MYDIRVTRTTVDLSDKGLARCIKYEKILKNSPSPVSFFVVAFCALC